MTFYKLLSFLHNISRNFSCAGKFEKKNREMGTEPKLKRLSHEMSAEFTVFALHSMPSKVCQAAYSAQLRLSNCQTGQGLQRLSLCDLDSLRENINKGQLIKFAD